MAVSVKMSPAQCADLFQRAHKAGMEAGQGSRPEPMHVVQLGRHGEVVKRYAPVMDGVCGFAWVTIRPGNSSFANWLRKQGKGHKGYHGGWEYWVGQFNQSLERKEAYARAFAEVCREAGVQAHAGSRMD
jgi:hypothetical protein